MVFSFELYLDLRILGIFHCSSGAIMKQGQVTKMKATLENKDMIQFCFLLVRLNMIFIYMYYISIYSEGPEDQNKVQFKIFRFII